MGWPARDVQAAGRPLICLLAAPWRSQTASLTAARIISWSISTSSGSQASGLISMDDLHLALSGDLDHAAAGRGVDGLGLEVLLRGGKLLLHLAGLLHHLLHVHTGHDGSFTCSHTPSCKGSRDAAGLQTQKSYHGARPASGAVTLPQSIYMSWSASRTRRLCKVE